MLRALRWKSSSSSSSGSFAGRLILPHLLHDADANPGNAKSQESLFKVLVDEDPQELIRRYQTGAYAMTEECSKRYVIAMERQGRIEEVGAKLHKGIYFYSLDDTDSNSE